MMARSFPGEKWLFRVVYPLMALAVIHVGNDNKFGELLRLPSYYSDLLVAAALTFGTGLYFRWYYRRHGAPVGPTGWKRERLVEYLVGTLVLPVVVLSALEAFYVIFILGIPAGEVTILWLETPLIVVFCLLVNAAYLIMGLRGTVRSISGESPESVPSYPRQFVVHGGARSRSLPIEEIAYFEVVDKVTFLVTVAGVRHILQEPLREIASLMDPDDFYALNRQVLAHRRGIREFERTQTRKLQVILEPAPAGEQFVAKAKATEFLQWLSGRPEPAA